MKAAKQLYRLILRLYPESFRTEFGAAMVEDFHAVLNERSGFWGRLRAATRDVLDVGVNAVRWRMQRRKPPPQRRRESRPRMVLAAMVQEFRHIVRSLARRPAFTALAAVTLAVGIGATTAIFTLADAVAFRPLAFFDSDRLAEIYHFHSGRGFDQSNASYPDFIQWRNERDLIEHAAVWTPTTMDLSGEGDPERIRVARVGDEFFETLAAPAVIGRTLDQADHRANAAPAVVLHEELWRRSFGGDTAVVGRLVRLQGAPHTVIGVVGARGQWPLGASAWVSLRFGSTPPAWADSFTNHTVGSGGPSA